MSKIKICHITSVHGRTDVRIQKFCQSLLKSNYEVSLLCMDGKASENIGGLQIKVSSFSPATKKERVLKSANKLLKEALQLNADIYHLHDPELLPLAIKLKKKGKKVIYDSHEDFPQQLRGKFAFPTLVLDLISWITTLYMNYCVRRFDATLSVTPHIIEKLKKASNQVYQVTNYPIVNTKEVISTKEEYMEKPNTLCYVGTVYEFSNQEATLEALESVSFPIIYTLLGSISNLYKKKLDEYPFASKVDFISQIPKSEVYKIYASSTMAVGVFDYLPDFGHKKGTLGSNKMFEYMQAGLPIICSDFDLWKEFVERYYCGICVPPGNSKAIQEAIEYLIAHKEEAYEMGQNGRKAVLEEFNWSTQEKIYLELIEEIAKSKDKSNEW